MINSVEQMNAAVNSLNEINEKLSSQEAAISCQQGEIVKTEAIIKQYQDWLKSQNDMLDVFMKQKESIEEEKDKILKSIQDYNNPVANGVKEVVSKNSNNTKPKPMTFEASYEIVKSTKSLKYYGAIEEQLMSVSPHNEVNYLNQTMIPNNLKISTVSRRMVLYRIDAIGEYPLDDIIRQPITMSIDLHIATGSGELLSLRGEDQQIVYHASQIQSCKSYSIEMSQTNGTKFVMLINTVPLVMALDIHNPPEDTFENSIQLSEKEGYTAIPPLDLHVFPECFVKLNLSASEARKKLLFFDASFAKNVNDFVVPISLTVINYEGMMIINTKMCPRTHIKSYGEERHGITEKDIIGSPDIEEILKRFYRLIWNKILVGFELKDKLRYLKIDLKYICGIRDLQSCPTVKKELLPAKAKYTLPELGDRLLRLTGNRGIYNAEQNAQTIRKVFLRLEHKWEDSVTAEELLKYTSSTMSPQVKSGPTPKKVKSTESLLPKGGSTLGAVNVTLTSGETTPKKTKWS